MSYQGGYYLLNEPFVRGYGANAHTAADTTGLSDVTVEAVNLIQDTPWMVNPFVADLVTALETIGDDVINSDGDTVLQVEKPLDPRKDIFHEINFRFEPEVWNAMTPEQRKEHRAKRAKGIVAWEKSMGTYNATKRVISSAQEMRDHEKFYYPHNLDFRTRIYPIPTDLNPQSSDLAKGLIQFARGTRLGPDGVFWLGVMTATHFGEDKLAMKDRYEFAVKNLRKWRKMVKNPLLHRDWVDADKPFQFLAVVHEWVSANAKKNPEDFVSYLPGNLDGSCNGAQHLSLLSRDLTGATATNCRSWEATCGVRFDLYQQVGDRVWEKVAADAEKGLAVAIEWSKKFHDPKARRKIVKRSVMTVPYGVTEYGIADFMIKDGHVDDKAANQWDSAKYMRDLIWNSIGEVLDKGKKLQVWFSDCASICAQNGKPMIWDTPAGSRVTQAYRNVIQKRIVAFDTKFYVYEEPQADEDNEVFLQRIGMDENKMRSAAPPNVVHSCDAAHLQLTVVKMAEFGIRDFSMIHDSFGCPMAHVGSMRDILRETIVDMYRGNYLEAFKSSVESYTGLSMPPVPEMGTFDLHEVLTSEFFFS